MGLSRKRRTRIIGAVLFAGLLAAGTYAFTASNTVAASKAGDGDNTITGYNVTNVHYTVNATDPSKLESVEFDLDAAAATVKAKLQSAGTTWYDCAEDALIANHWECTTGTAGIDQPNVLDLDELRVVAAE